MRYEGDTGGESRVGSGGAADKYDGTLYAGGHKFDLEMQEDTFVFWDRWL